MRSATRRSSLVALSFLLAAAISPVGVSAQVCPLPGGGAISGLVTAEDSDEPVVGARVLVTRLVGGFPSGLAETTTGPTGHYQVAELAAGDYLVYTQGTALLVDEVWPGSACDQICNPQETGTAVAVASGAFVQGIDFALDEGGRIEGFVRLADGTTPAAGALVEGFALGPFGTFGLGQVAAGVDGGWAFEGLQGLSYKVRASAPGLVAEVYPDSACPIGCDVLGDGDPIAVTEGATVSGIDLALAAGAVLSGTVTDLSAEPIAGTFVLVYASDGFRSIGDSTDANGAWSAPEGLPPGTYYARTAGDHVDELWDDVACEPFCTVTSGTPIVVSDSEPVSGIDFELERLGAIEGTVVESGSGTPLGGVSVVARGGVQPAFTTTAADGSFRIGGLAAGSYLLAAADGIHVGEVYDNAGTCYDVLQCSPAVEPTLVEVVGTATTTGIDFTLAPGGALLGSVVVAATQAPIEGASIEIFRLDGAGELTLFSNAEGRFGMTGLPAGVSYRVLARPPFGAALLGEVWEEQPCNPVSCSPDAGTPVPVTAGAIACVTFTLGGDGAGATAIAGQVTGPNGPLEGAQVAIYDSVGNSIGAVLTDESGMYLTAGALALAPGTYYVIAGAFGHLSELYDNLPCSGCDPTTGTPVVAIEGATTGDIDFTLQSTGLGLPLIFLQDCKPGGCVYSPGNEDSRTNRSSIVGTTRFLPESQLPADSWNELVACVRNAYRPFAVEVTDVDPGNQPHLEHVIAGNPSHLGQDQGVAGVSPFTCGFIPNSISFNFAGLYGPTPSTAGLYEICWTAVHEIAHQHGLDHHAFMPDAMTYIAGCEPKTLPLRDVPCGEETPRACVCGGTIENSYERIRDIHGSSGVLFTDGFEILQPGESCVWTDRDPPPGPTDLFVDRTKQASSAPGLRCGTLDPDNPGLRIAPVR